MTQGRIWHALQPNWSMLTILMHCSFTPLLWPPCTRLIYVSTLGVFIRPQWSVVYPQRFYNFTMQVNLACPLGTRRQDKVTDNDCGFLKHTSYQPNEFKGIVSDYNNVFSWHKLEDINKISFFQNFSWSQFYIEQVMHDYVHWHCSIDYCVKLSLVDKTFCIKNSFHSIRKGFLLNSFWRNVFLGGELQIDTKN